MKIKIGNKEIQVPAFIAEASPENRAEMDTFIKALLTAHAEKIRNKYEMELYKKEK